MLFHVSITHMYADSIFLNIYSLFQAFPLALIFFMSSIIALPSPLPSNIVTFLAAFIGRVLSSFAPFLNLLSCVLPSFPVLRRFWANDGVRK